MIASSSLEEKKVYLDTILQLFTGIWRMSIWNSSHYNTYIIILEIENSSKYFKTYARELIVISNIGFYTKYWRDDLGWTIQVYLPSNSWVSYGFLWFPMVSYDFLWFPMVSYGFLWFPMAHFVVLVGNAVKHGITDNCVVLNLKTKQKE